MEEIKTQKYLSLIKFAMEKFLSKTFMNNQELKIWFNLCLMDIMQQFLPMDRLEQERLLQWRATNTK